MTQEQILQRIKYGKKFLEKNDLDGFFGSLYQSDVAKIAEFLLTKTSVDILKYMTFIPNDFLLGTSNVTNLHIPGNIKKIGKTAFANSAIETVTMDSGVETLGIDCFLNSNLKAIDLSDTIVNIPKGCFLGCNNLQKVFLPDAVRNIGNDAFAGCDNVELIANYRTADKIRAKKSDYEFLKQHLKFEHPERQNQQETEN